MGQNNADPSTRNRIRKTRNHRVALTPRVLAQRCGGDHGQQVADHHLQDAQRHLVAVPRIRDVARIGAQQPVHPDHAVELDAADEAAQQRHAEG